MLITDEVKPDSGPYTDPPSNTCFDYSNVPTSGKCISDSSNATTPVDLSPGVVIIPPTPLTIRKESDSENQVEGKNTEVLSPVVKKTLTVRTSSLPLVPVSEEADKAKTIDERKKSKSHEDLIKAEKSVTDSKVELSHVKMIDSEAESKHHTNHKYSIKKFKQRLRHGKKRDKNAEKSRKHSNENESDNHSETESFTYEEVASQGSRSENEESILSDEDINAGGEDAMMPEKKNGFFRRMSVKMKQLVLGHEDDEENESEKRSRKRDEQIVVVNDLTDDNSNSKPSLIKMTVRDLVHGCNGRLLSCMVSGYLYLITAACCMFLVTHFQV